MVVGASIDCYAQTGTVHLTVVKAQFIASTGSGTGTLNYQGRTYRLSVSSVASAPSESLGASWWAPPTICGPRRTSPARIRRQQPGLRSVAASRWHDFKMRTASSSNWLEHSLAKRYPCFGWDDHCFASSVISIVI